MANKRMFNIEIIDADKFLDMPNSSQNLYFHLAMRADDDGFISNPKKIQRIVGASDDDANILITKEYVLKFENGLIVIKHWRIHNYLRSDRYKPSLNTNQREQLLVEENREYTLKNDGIPTGYLDKISLIELSLNKSNSKEVNNFNRFKELCIKNYEKIIFTLPYPFENLMKDTIVKMTSSGYLLNVTINKLFDKHIAFKIWDYMYSKEERIIKLIENKDKS
jgi:hypothetical protein